MEIIIPWENDALCVARQFPRNRKGQYQTRLNGAVASATPKANFVVYDTGVLNEGVTYTIDKTNDFSSTEGSRGNFSCTFNTDKITMYSYVSSKNSASLSAYTTLNLMLPELSQAFSYINIVLDGTYSISANSGSNPPDGNGYASAESAIFLNGSSTAFQYPLTRVYKSPGSQSGDITLTTPISLSSEKITQISLTLTVQAYCPYSNRTSSSTITQNIKKIELLA